MNKNSEKKSDFICFDKEIEITLLPENAKDITKTYHHEATPNMLQDFVEASGIHKASSLTFDVELRPFRDGIHITLIGDMNFEQICVISLEPIKQDIHFEHNFDLLLERSYAQHMQRLEEDNVYAQEQLMKDDPELLSHQGVRLLALCYELITLNFDPYPRAEQYQEQFQYVEDDLKDKSSENNPFAKLAELLPKE